MLSLSLVGMVVLKGRRPDLFEDDKTEYDESLDSDEDTVYTDSILADDRDDQSDHLLQYHEQVGSDIHFTKWLKLKMFGFAITYFFKMS